MSSAMKLSAPRNALSMWMSCNLWLMNGSVDPPEPNRLKQSLQQIIDHHAGSPRLRDYQRFILFWVIYHIIVKFKIGGENMAILVKPGACCFVPTQMGAE